MNFISKFSLSLWVLYYFISHWQFQSNYPFFCTCNCAPLKAFLLVFQTTTSQKNRAISKLLHPCWELSTTFGRHSVSWFLFLPHVLWHWHWRGAERARIACNYGSYALQKKRPLFSLLLSSLSSFQIVRRTTNDDFCFLFLFCLFSREPPHENINSGSFCLLVLVFGFALCISMTHSALEPLDQTGFDWAWELLILLVLWRPTDLDQGKFLDEQGEVNDIYFGRNYFFKVLNFKRSFIAYVRMFANVIIFE